MEKKSPPKLQNYASLLENPYAFLRAEGIYTAQFITKVEGDECVLYFQYREGSSADHVRDCAKLFLERQYKAVDISFWRNPKRPTREFYAKFKRG